MSSYNSDDLRPKGVLRLLSRVADRFGYSPERGRAVARAAAEDFSAGVPFAYVREPGALQHPVAIVCHLFHEDLAASIYGHLQNVQLPADLFISTDTKEKQQVIQAVFAAWHRGGVDVRVVPNRGRDIAPKFIAFADVYATHDLVLFLHSKKSPHWEEGNRWRDYLLQTLLGSPQTVNSVVEAFERLPQVGMIVPQHYAPLRRLIGWTMNYAVALKLARGMGFVPARHTTLDLPSGSMFWARSAALKPLLDLHLAMEDFPEEAGQTDGTTAHAIERLLLYICERAGYTWMKIADITQANHSPTIAAIDSPEALTGFAREHTFSLLALSGSSVSQ